MTEHRYTACGGVLVRGTQVLVLVRPSRAEVRLPKGHLEKGESPRQAALREVLEEAGYEPVVIADLGQQLVEFDYAGRHFVRTERYFLMSPRNPEQGPARPGEPEFDPLWLSWEEAIRTLTFDAEREWVRRAHEFIGRQ